MPTRSMIFVTVLALLLGACKPAQAPVIPTAPAEVIPSPSAPLQPVSEGTPIPSLDLASINAQNISQLTELARWGKGTVVNLMWASNTEYYIATGSGIEAYSLPGPTLRYRINSDTPLYSALLTPDGQKLIGGSKNIIYVWDAQTGALVETAANEGADYIQSMAISPDGRWLAIDHENQIQIWEFPLHLSFSLSTGEGISALAFSPDGHWLASGSGHSNGESVTLWDTQTWVESLSIGTNLTDEYDHIANLVFSPDGKNIFVNQLHQRDGNVRIYNTLTGELNGLLPESQQIFEIVLSPDGNSLAGTYWKRNSHAYIQLWDWQQRVKLNILQDEQVEPIDMAFSPDGRYLLTGPWHQDGIGLWHIEEARLEARYAGYYSDAVAADISANGRFIAVSHLDDSIELRDVQAGNVIASYQENEALAVEYLSFSPDGHYLATALSSGIIRILDGNSLQLVASLDLNAWATPLVFTPDSQYLFGIVEDKLVIWETDNWQTANRVDIGAEGYAGNLALSPDGNLVAIAPWDGALQIWDWQAKTLVKMLSDYRQVRSLTFSPNGQWLAVGTYDTLSLLSVAADYKEIYRGGGGSSTAMVFSTDSSLLFTGRDFYSVAESGLSTLSVSNFNLLGHGFPILSTDGRMLITFVSDGTIRVWGVPREPTDQGVVNHPVQRGITADQIVKNVCNSGDEHCDVYYCFIDPSNISHWQGISIHFGGAENQAAVIAAWGDKASYGSSGPKPFVLFTNNLGSYQTCNPLAANGELSTPEGCTAVAAFVTDTDQCLGNPTAGNNTQNSHEYGNVKPADLLEIVQSVALVQPGSGAPVSGAPFVVTPELHVYAVERESPGNYDSIVPVLIGEGSMPANTPIDGYHHLMEMIMTGTSDINLPDKSCHVDYIQDFSTEDPYKFIGALRCKGSETGWIYVAERPSPSLAESIDLGPIAGFVTMEALKEAKVAYQYNFEIRDRRSLSELLNRCTTFWQVNVDDPSLDIDNFTYAEILDRLKSEGVVPAWVDLPMYETIMGNALHAGFWLSGTGELKINPHRVLHVSFGGGDYIIYFLGDPSHSFPDVVEPVPSSISATIPGNAPVTFFVETPGWVSIEALYNAVCPSYPDLCAE